MEIDNSYFYQSIAFTFKNPDINEKHEDSIITSRLFCLMLKETNLVV